MTRPFPIFLFLLATFSTTAALGEDGPAQDVPELQALSEYVGKWDVVISPNETMEKVEGEATAEWILDGTFVQQTGFLKQSDGTPYVKVMALMTYDKIEKTYRMWTFNSQGSGLESTGQWDAEKRTMTWVHRTPSGDRTRTTTAHFLDDGSEHWTIVATNEKNEVLSEFGGINTRREK